MPAVGDSAGLHDAERAVLGAALLDPDAARTAAELLTAEDFAEERHGVIFDGVLRVLANGGSPDLLLVTEALRSAGTLQRAGGAAYLSELLDVTPDVANVAHYAGLLRRGAAHRRATSAMRAAALDPQPATVAAAKSALDELEHGAQGEPVGVVLADVPPERVDWLWPGRIPLGKLTVLDGDPGLGKSTILLDLCARLSTGRPFPFAGDYEPVNGGAVVLTAEDGLGDTVRPRLEAAGANLACVLALQTIGKGKDRRGIQLPADLPIVEAAIRRVDARLVVVDPLMAFLAGEVNSHRDQDIRRALFALSDLAERTGVALTLVRHLNKRGGGIPLYRGGGSIGIAAAARSGLLVGKKPGDDEVRVLASTKSNLARPPRSVEYRLDPAGGVAVVRWTEESDTTAADLVAPPQRRRDLAQAEAEDFLTSLLSDGPIPAAEVWSAARAASLSRNTVQRAKSRLGIASTQGRDGWLWSLPNDTPETQSPNSGFWGSAPAATMPITQETQSVEGRAPQSPNAGHVPKSMAEPQLGIDPRHWPAEPRYELASLVRGGTPRAEAVERIRAQWEPNRSTA